MIIFLCLFIREDPIEKFFTHFEIFDWEEKISPIIFK